MPFHTINFSPFFAGDDHKASMDSQLNALVRISRGCTVLSFTLWLWFWVVAFPQHTKGSATSWLLPSKNTNQTLSPITAEQCFLHTPIPIVFSV